MVAFGDDHFTDGKKMVDGVEGVHRSGPSNRHHGSADRTPQHHSIGY